MKCKHMHKDAPENVICEDCINKIGLPKILFDEHQVKVKEFEKHCRKVIMKQLKKMKGGKENGNKNN